MVDGLQEISKKHDVQIPCYGHAGDGNIHVNIMLDKKNKEMLNRAKAAIEDLFRKTVALGGTISGEHGIGITKAPYLAMELGSEEIALMKKIKIAFDPNGILNPGKIFPEIK